MHMYIIICIWYVYIYNICIMYYCKYLQLEPQLPKNTGNWRVASTYPSEPVKLSLASTRCPSWIAPRMLKICPEVTSTRISDKALHTTVFAKMLPPVEPPHISWSFGPKSESNNEIFTWNKDFMEKKCMKPRTDLWRAFPFRIHLSTLQTDQWRFLITSHVISLCTQRHTGISDMGTSLNFMVGWGPCDSAGFPNWNLYTISRQF